MSIDHTFLNFASDEEVIEKVVGRLDGLKSSNKGKAYKTQTIAIARDALFLEQLKDCLSQAFSGLKLGSRTKPTKKKFNQKRILNLVLSDTHYRSMLDPREVGMAYGPVEEARRTAQVVLQACDYKAQYRKDTTLKIHLLGDIIQNQLHDARDGQPLAEQCAAAISILVQAISYCAVYFPKVEVHCTSGNHGRNLKRHNQRAVHQKWDSIETIIYFAVKKALVGCKNVSMEIARTPYYTCDLFDKKAFFTHGDTVLKCGYPGQSINVQSLRRQANEWNSSRVAGGPFSLFVIGHVHIGSIINLPGGTSLITNGCLPPSDSFSLSIGSPDVSSGQYLWESVPGYALGDSRFIRVDEETDQDERLDLIIKPFTDF